MTLLFKAKDVYGRPMFYPACPEAQCITDLAGRKCFKEVEIRRLIQAGFLVRIEVAALSESRVVEFSEYSNGK